MVATETFINCFTDLEIGPLFDGPSRLRSTVNLHKPARPENRKGISS